MIEYLTNEKMQKYIVISIKQKGHSNLQAYIELK